MKEIENANDNIDNVITEVHRDLHDAFCELQSAMCDEDGEKDELLKSV